MEAWKPKRTVLERGFTFVELWVAKAMDAGPWVPGSEFLGASGMFKLQGRHGVLLHSPYSVRSWLIGRLPRTEPV
jgi:hypothetical protein